MSEEDLYSDDDQRISNIMRALQQSTPGSLRHRQITSILQKRLQEREEQREGRATLSTQARQVGYQRGAQGARTPPTKERFCFFANHAEERLGRPAPENHRGGNGNEEIESKTGIGG